MRLLPALALLPLLLAPAAAADSPGIAGILAPEISPDGSQIAFSYQGDIWVVPSSGGRAHRLTDNPAFDTNPVWNDAGTEIAFSSNRRGNHDIYRMRLTGGQPDRITFAPHDDLVTDWQGDTLLFSSRREPYSGELYAIGIPASGDGSAMERRVTVDMSRYSYGRFSPSGQGIAAARGNIGWTRKEYRGSADHDLVVLDRDGSDIRIAAGSETMEGDTFDSFPAWGAGETLYFISDRDGWGKNLYRLTEGGPRKLTDYSKDQDGAVFLSADRDGSTLCFAVQGKLHLLESAGGTPRPVPVTIDAEMKRTTLERTALAGGVTEFAVSPDGKYVAAVVRGDILIVPVIDPEEPPPPDSPRYGESWNVTDSVWRDFEVDWHPDGDRIAYVCDEDGDFEVFIRDLNTRGTTQITRDEVGELAPKFSPDGKKLAYIRGNRELVVADADGKHAKVVATTGLVWGGIFRQDYRWSPDSRWIAYEDQDPSFTNELMVVPADGSTPPRNATRHFANDFTPRWSADGKYLYFASDRGNLGDLDPRVSNVYRIQLKRRPPPFSDEFVFGKDAEDEDAEEEDEPSDDGEADNEDGEGEPEEADGNAGEGDGAEEGKKEEAEEEPEPVEIDFTDIDLRVEQVSGTAGNALGGDLSPDGKYLVYAADPMGHPALYAVRTADNKTTTLTEGGVGASNTGALPITFSPDGTAVYYLTEGGGIGVVKFSNGQNSGGGALQVRATKDIDTTAELRQMYREAWRSLRDGFYDPAMHGVDWDAVYEKYLPLATNAATREEFYTIVNLMLGELHASHLGIFGAGSFSGIPESGASLGVDFDEGYDGEGLKIASVVWRGPADQEESRLRPGEVILTVNGQPVDRHHTIWRPLENQAYRTVRLRVRGTDGAERDVKIWPIDLGTLNTLKYDQWVEGNRRKVEESSNGNVGYIHIRSMDAPSLQMFYRELYTRAADKDGLVIDVRFNGGGWIHEQLLDALNRDPIGKGQLRGDRMVTQPPRRFAGRMVLLINEYSYSDAEIFPMGFRNQQLGTIIGRPTGGAVIGTLNYPLIEGTQFRIPLMGWYDLDGRNMENWGVPPDIHITNDPNGYRRGEDAQLQRAIQVVHASHGEHNQ